tara:strand:- start:213 stop:623 length:411 start_codon:yes stop_codon:yes gene_type:complete
VSPYAGGRRLSLVAAMDIHGIRRHAIIDGGVTGGDFLRFSQAVLGPSLRRGKVVVMDNLRLHENPVVLATATAPVPGRLHPALQPRHESDRARVLEARASGPEASSLAALRSAFDRACEAITPRDARNYIRHAGYS